MKCIEKLGCNIEGIGSFDYLDLLYGKGFDVFFNEEDDFCLRQQMLHFLHLSST